MQLRATHAIHATSLFVQQQMGKRIAKIDYAQKYLPHFVKLAQVTNILKTQFQHSIKRRTSPMSFIKPIYLTIKMQFMGCLYNICQP